MDKHYSINNADFGITLQSCICKYYGLQPSELAEEHFSANYNAEYEPEFTEILPRISESIGAKPIKLLTYTKDLTNSKQNISPHTFLLDTNETLSIRTNKKGDKIAPKTVGQAGYATLNEYFGEIYGKKILNKDDIKHLILEHISEILPIFIDNLFQSDYTILIKRSNIKDFLIIRASDLADFVFSKEDFSFTRDFNSWKESTTLKFNNISIAEIQIHKNRTFKFRFIVSAIPSWISTIKQTTETLGITAEAAICDAFSLAKPDSFKHRVSVGLEKKLFPVIKDAFSYLPRPIAHTGSEKGERGGQSKCAYDFKLSGGQTLSLKTNTGKMVCPPDVGQPGKETCLKFFKDFFPAGTTSINNDDFKKMVFSHISDLLPIYTDHLFESDWLLWIYEKGKKYTYRIINKNDIKAINWKREQLSFTRPSIDEWKESNTVKYNNITIGEFQVHQHRSCFKFRFNLANLLSLLKQ